jgi:hypothetical protein
MPAPAQVKHIVTCVAASEHIAKNMTADDWAMSQWVSDAAGTLPCAAPTDAAPQQRCAHLPGGAAGCTVTQAAACVAAHR